MMSLNINEIDLVKLLHSNAIVYTTEELANRLKTTIANIHMLRKLGAIKGTKVGKYYLYSYMSVNEFLARFEGCDMSNEDMVRISVIETNKKGLNRLK